MKIRCFLMLLVLAFLLVGCTDETPIQTTEITPPAEEVVTTEAPIVTSEPPVTTEKVEPPINPVQPPITVGDEFEKKAIDSLGYGGINFTHSVKYPKIDLDTPGAIAFNEKLAAPHAPLIKELRDGTEGRNLYRVGYNAAYTGPYYSTIMIHFTSFGGVQYSEGSSSQKFFYFDAINDREITVKEYLESMDVDLDKALDAALWSYDLASAGFTADYEGEAELTAGTEYKETLDGSILTKADKNRLYYQRHTEFANSVVLDGAYADPQYITLYFHGSAYVQSTFSITLDKETLLPVRPNYEAEIGLTFTDTDKIEILFENGIVTSATAPVGYEDIRIIFSPSKVDLISPERLDDAKVVINGGNLLRWGNAGGMDGGFSYQYFPLEYTELEALESVVIHVNKDTEPPIQTAMHYIRDAYSIYSGGKLDIEQRIFYPKITVGTDAAEEFNYKIKAKYAPIIKELEKGDDHRIYDISYSYAFYDGAIAICIDSNIGRQGTEGGSSREMFYFDITNDRELTLEEYALRLGINIDLAKDGALWSYDLGSAGYASGESTFSKEVGGKPAALAKNEFFYQKYGGFDESVNLDGIAVYDDTVVLYMSGHAYVSTIFTVTLDKETLLPELPNYMISIDTENAADGEFEIEFEGGKVKSVSLPKGVAGISVTSSYVYFTSSVTFKTDSFKINGKKWGLAFSASYDTETENLSYSFSPDTYRSPEELSTITIEKR